MSGAAELARRLASLEHFRWMPGMLTMCGIRCGPGSGTGRVEGHSYGWAGRWCGGDGAGMSPDITDPATLGCLLALAQEAHESPHAYCRPSASGWVVYLTSWARTGITNIEPTREEALVAALEAAP